MRVLYINVCVYVCVCVWCALRMCVCMCVCLCLQVDVCFHLYIMRAHMHGVHMHSGVCVREHVHQCPNNVFAGVIAHTHVNDCASLT
jgi:hypothetical protein